MHSNALTGKIETPTAYLVGKEEKNYRGSVSGYVLKQKWRIEHYENGILIKTEEEWRSIPKEI
jgi:hypothetical protein